MFSPFCGFYVTKCTSVYTFHSLFSSDTGVMHVRRRTRASTGTRRTKEQPTNLITDVISPHCLSAFLLAGETRGDAPASPSSSSSGCTEMYISRRRRTRDNISLQRQISLQIKIPSIMSGRIRSDKSQRQTAARRTGKH